MNTTTGETELRQRLERIGATVRIQEINAELGELRAAFPDLDGDTPAPAAPVLLVNVLPTPKRRRRMSAAAKLAVSKRMKKYWRDRRNAQA